MHLQTRLLFSAVCLGLAGAAACSGTASPVTDSGDDGTGNGASSSGATSGFGSSGAGSSGAVVGGGSGTTTSSGVTSSSGAPSSSGATGSSGAPSSSGTTSGPGGSSGSSSGSPSGSGSSSGTASSSGAPSDDGGTVGTGVLAGCTIAGGCPLNIDCSYANAADDPLASTSPSDYDIYDACIVAGLAAAGFNDAWVGQLLKGQAVQEGGQITSSDSNGKVDDDCGGQNCGMWSISAGASSGDTSKGGVCGVTTTDPLTGNQDWSHSYALFQDTPGCEGTFLIPTLPSGYTLVGTGTADIVPWTQTQKVFYAEAETSLGVTNLTGQTVSGVIDAVMDPTDPYYGQSIFYPAYNLYVHMSYTFAQEYLQAQGTSSGCDPYQMMYKVIAYWLNGDISNDCNVPAGGGQGGDLKYVKDALSAYKTMYGQTWPYEAPVAD